MFALTSRRLRGTARRVFGWQHLRPAQLSAMKAVMKGRDVLAVMPTGAGKSAVYQVPAVLLGGPVVVVSPLIALQRDQMQSLLGSGALRTAAVNSAQRKSDNETAWARISASSVDVVFLAPEQLAKPDVTDRLAAVRPRLLVVDEAHCVSSWGTTSGRTTCGCATRANGSATRRCSPSPRTRRPRYGGTSPNASA